MGPESKEIEDYTKNSDHLMQKFFQKKERSDNCEEIPKKLEFLAKTEVLLFRSEV